MARTSVSASFYYSARGWWGYDGAARSGRSVHLPLGLAKYTTGPDFPHPRSLRMLALLLLALPFAFSKEVEVVLASSPRWVFPNGDPGRDMVPADAVGCAGGELLYFQGSLELAFNGKLQRDGL